MGNREHRWRCAWSLVTLQDAARPLDGIAHPDAGWLRVRPELEVLGTIVVPQPFRWWTVSPSSKYLPSRSSATSMCSNTYGPLVARG